MASNNVNSFAENMADMVAASNEILGIANALNQSINGDNTTVTLSNGTILPSYSTVLNRLNKVENTVAQFTQGSGTVETNDGTYRKIKVTTIAKAPGRITDVANISKFTINPNWFFESLQYPRCIVNIDLKDKIDDSADRVYVNRIILDSTLTVEGSTSMLDFYSTYILNKKLSYDNLLAVLTDHNIQFREDKDEIKLPLTYEKYNGNFTVLSHQLIQDTDGISRLWYYLDTLNYSTVDESGLNTNNGNILSVGDFVRFDDSLYKVIEIAQDEKRIRIEGSIGFQVVGDLDILHFYNTPFMDKTISVGIGINEIDIIYIKAVNEEYNLLSKTWSEPISFYSNDLTLDGTNTKFSEYYTENVADFGKNWIAQAKEKQVSAYNGLQPNSPTLNLQDLRVVQINTQLNATLDTDKYNQLTSDIAATKTNIAATRNTISKNKDLLIQLSSSGERDNIQNVINSDTESLNSLTTQYNSLVEELNTLLNEAGAISYTPKYHIRGFFGIPASRYLDESNQVGEQSIIGFETMYRYLHTDETGVDLGTFSYSAGDIVQTGVFTDWNMSTSIVLEKVYDVDTDTFYWNTTNTLDGTEININQIDIPIRSGEKVEIKVRSISEAGYPYNPLKSEWSNSVIVEFPDNLTTNDSVTTILETVKNDMTAVVLQETMSAAGVYSHIADANSTFKHEAKNIQYSEIVTDASGNTTITTMSTQDKIKALTDVIADLNKRVADLEQQA